MQNNTTHDPLVIAEIGCNHCGNFDTAMKMIKTAAATMMAVSVREQGSQESLTRIQ